MNTFIQQVFEILTTAPGSLIYHLILIFSITAALQVIFTVPANHTSRNRFILGLGFLLAAQAFLFLCAGLVWQGVINARDVLPPLDRILTAFTLLWVIWLWVFPSPRRTADVLHAVLNLVLVLLALFTITAWSNQSELVPFNLSIFDIGWNTFIILIAILGVVAISLARPNGWGTGLAMMLLILAGSAFHLLWTLPEGDFAAGLRIAAIASYPLLPGLVLVFQNQETESQPKAPAAAKTNGFVERRRYNAEPRAVYAWLQVAAEQEPAKIYPALTHAIAQSMLSDLCLYITQSPATRDLVIQTGWDLIRDESIRAGFILEQHSMPAIANAFQRGRSITLDANSPTTLDLESLSKAIGLQQIHNLLFVPVNTPQRVLGGIALLSLYSERNWSPEDQSYLITGIESIARIIQRIENTPASDFDHQSLIEEINNLKSQLDQVKEENQAIKHMDLVQSESTQVEDLLSLNYENQKLINDLKQENQHLQDQILQLQSTTATHKDDLIQAEIYELSNLLDAAQSRINELETRTAQNIESDHALATEKVAQILTSIIGYTDLLLSETTGALSSLQRNFLDRIHHSTILMKEMLENQDQNSDQPASIQVDITNLIDEAIMQMRPQLREKDLNLRVDIPSELPSITTEPASLLQVLVILIRNAVLASSQQGNINLMVRTDEADGKQNMVIQVTDFGGGITPRELPQVFNRLYNGDHGEINGLGENGANLAAAKSLTEANGGRIWVESQPDLSTTISILVPVSQSSENHLVHTSKE